MCEFHYKLVECSNADYMSPSSELPLKLVILVQLVVGTSPFLIIPVEQGSLILSSFEAITKFIETQVSPM